METLIDAVRLYSQVNGMEFGIEKYAMLVMKSGKRHLTDGREQPNQDKIRTLGENVTNKYLGILEADTIKQVGTKKIRENISGEQDSYSRQNYLAETLSKECIPGLYLR